MYNVSMFAVKMDARRAGDIIAVIDLVATLGYIGRLSSVTPIYIHLLNMLCTLALPFN